MTDEQIIKALECCAYWESDKSCEDCPENTYGFGCGNKLAKHSLDLINRQKAEIEELYSDKIIAETHEKAAKDLCVDCAKQHEEAKAEIKRLKERISYLEESIDCSRKEYNRLLQKLQQAKSEAIKEFAARLKCGVPQETGVIMCADVDNLVKEMTEV